MSCWTLTGAAVASCAELWHDDGVPRTFGLGEPDLGPGNAGPGTSPEARPGRFSLCGGLVATSGPVGPGWEALAPAPREDNPRDPLRGVRNASAPLGT